MRTIEQLGNNLDSARDRDFLTRIYSTPPQVYAERIDAIGFSNIGKVLDVGCGFGQWTQALAINNDVVGIDCDSTRISTAAQISSIRKVDRVSYVCGSMESLPFNDNSIDGVFSFSAIYYGDYTQALREFSRVLKPGGWVYFSANAAGWYLHNLIKNPNPSENFSPRKMAINALWNSLKAAAGYQIEGERSVCVNTAKRTLSSAGLEIIDMGGDGCIRLPNTKKPKSFFPEKTLGLTAVFEMLCKKRR